MSDEPGLTQEKGALCMAMPQQLQAMTSDDRTARSEKICPRIVDLPIWQEENSRLSFSLPRSEAQLDVPFVPELLLVPDLAFSRDGRRLGRGGGFSIACWTVALLPLSSSGLGSLFSCWKRSRSRGTTL